MLEVSYEDKAMTFGNRRFQPAIRMLYDIKEVIYDKDWLAKSKNFEIYYMYRDLYLTKKDCQAIKERSLRYDITIIPPHRFGREYVKTAGHYHPLVTGENAFTYPELYEVLSGEAHYILQKVTNSGVEDVVLIEARQGDKVLIPSNYGHITINPSNKVLEMANFVERNFQSVYEPIKVMGGGAYFELAGGKFIKNTNYSYIPELRRLKPASECISELKHSIAMYSLFSESPDFLECLTKPSQYTDMFIKILKSE